MPRPGGDKDVFFQITPFAKSAQSRPDADKATARCCMACRLARVLILNTLIVRAWSFQLQLAHRLALQSYTLSLKCRRLDVGLVEATLMPVTAAERACAAMSMAVDAMEGDGCHNGYLANPTFCARVPACSICRSGRSMLARAHNGLFHTCFI